MRTRCVAFAFIALFLCGAAGCGSGDDSDAAAPREAGSDAKAPEGGSGEGGGEGGAPKTEAGSEASADGGSEAGSEAAAVESGAEAGAD